MLSFGEKKTALFCDVLIIYIFCLHILNFEIVLNTF